MVIKQAIDFKIRRFKLDDIEDVMRINRVFLPENYPEFFFRDIYRNCPEAFLVATVDDKVVGYIMCRIESSYLFRKGSKGHVISLAVADKYRRQGIGKTLLKSAIEVLKKKVNYIYLEVRVSNTPAINLYKNLGFRIERRLYSYYQDGEDAYLMSLTL